MSNPTGALDNYSKAVAAVKEHQAANQSVFKEHERLFLRVIDTENELRDSVAISMQNVANGDHEVTVTKQTQTWADIDTIDALIKQGLIDPKLRDQIIKTQERPPRIAIRERK